MWEHTHEALLLATGLLVLSGNASTLRLQQALGLSHDAAAALMRHAQWAGVVPPPDPDGRRQVIPCLRHPTPADPNPCEGTSL